MMHLHNPFKRKPKPIQIVPIEDVLPDPAPIVQGTAAAHVISKGRIVKTKGIPDYRVPGKDRPQGGRVVRTMPRELRKMKEQAENADV